MNEGQRQKNVAVIGGGISGLSAAFELQQLNAGYVVDLYDASPRLGGILKTEQHDSFLVEHSADMFATQDPWALELCRRIDFDEQLISTNEQDRRAFVVRDGTLVPVPQGFALMSPAKLKSVFDSTLLSSQGKLRLAAEQFVPRRESEDDECLRDFATRRFGKETFERLIQPLVGGIYTADPTKLSMQGALSRFVKMEREYGSLILAARRPNPSENIEAEASGARYGQFVAPRNGMQSLVDAIAAKLRNTNIHVSSRVNDVVRTADSWTVTSENRSKPYDGIVIALPAHASSRLLTTAAPNLSRLLGEIPYASAAIVPLVYKKSRIEKLVKGFGFVVPAIERSSILACSFSSMKFAGRAADDLLLCRVFIGGALQYELLDREDDELLNVAHSTLAKLLGIDGSPQWSSVIRWSKAMAQYHLGHVDLVERIRQYESDLQGFALSGNAFEGVGIPQCVRSGQNAAINVHKNLANSVA